MTTFFFGLVAVALLIFGTLAYLGVIRRWSPVDRGFDEYLGFAALYFGLSFSCLVASTLVPDESAVREVFIWTGLALLLFSIVIMFHCPRILLPKWWKDKYLRSH